MSPSNKAVAAMAPEFFAGTVADPAAAEAVCARLSAAMRDLLAVVERETALVREGRLQEAGALQPEKAALISVYVRGMTYVKEHAVALGNLAPHHVEALKRQHGEFQPVLRINLAVLATAREVADGLIRQVAEAAAAFRSPRTYGPGGAAPQSPGPAGGISVNRSL